MGVRCAPQFSPRRKVLSALVAFAFSGATLANPTGPSVVSGSATFATTAKTLTVTNTPSAIINWQGFSIGVGETTRFVQQSAASAVLNRVVGQDPSAILGTLSSNGRVFLLNPNGILFGVGSRVDVAGLVASTLNLSNQDFLAGRLNFEAGAVANPILNHGDIATPSGGRVYLIAPNVENHGLISTPQGQTILAAGKTVQMVEADVPNLRVEVQAGGEALNVGQILAEGGSAGIYAGLINQRGIVRANSVSRDATGRIVFRSDVLINTGSVKADGAQGGSVAIQARNILSAGQITAEGSQGRGGEIDLQASGRILQTSAARLSADGEAGGGKVTLQAADRVFGSGTLSAIGQGAGSTGGGIKVLGNDIVLLGARLDASGDAGGGSVLVGGDFQGKNPAVPNAATNWINFSTTINADARTAGHGGKVIVWSDRETQFYGNISARGGTQAGDGGFIEVSGKENLVFGGMADAGAPNGRPGTLLLDPAYVFIDSAGSGALSSVVLADPNPGAGDQFPDAVTVLANGNIIATDRRDDFVATDEGAVYLFNGVTGALISTITGGSANDNVGGSISFGEGGSISPIVVLNNGNFLVRSHNWDNPLAPGGVVATDTGAVTFGNAATGFIGGGGMISASNSLIGTSLLDRVGDNITLLPNGNYVVRTPNWDNPTGPVTNVGAVTFGSGTNGVTGVISAANSLIGSTASDTVGSTGITVLPNGNYLVRSQSWGNAAATNAGAVTFASGTSGVSGVVSATNSLVGSSASDAVGGGGITILPSGNYLVQSPNWDNPAGPVADVGAVTFGSGTGGVSGVISVANSLIGSSLNDRVGDSGITVLSSGNYLVRSPNWDNPAGPVGPISDAGAVTLGSGTMGVSGLVSQSNSLVGIEPSSFVGSGGVTELGNGNYIVRSPSWKGRRGAVTLINAATGQPADESNIISDLNSLVGSQTSDQVGSDGTTELTNGHYVVKSRAWNNGGATFAGAVTWVNGTNGHVAGTTSAGAVVSSANSLVGNTTNAQVGANGVTPLPNGNYVVDSVLWNGIASNGGAVTWVNGTNGHIAGSTSPGGVVSSSNSLVGNQTNDFVGSVVVLSNGHYVVRSTNWGDSLGTTGIFTPNCCSFNRVPGLGAVTWVNGTNGHIAGTSSPGGFVSAANSLTGSLNTDRVGIGGIMPLPSGDYLVLSRQWNFSAGAVTWVKGTNGHIAGTTSPGGIVSAANSLVGSTQNDGVSRFTPVLLPNGDYVVVTPNWDNVVTGALNTGAVTFGSGTTGFIGAISPTNSLVGSQTNDQVGSGFVTVLSNGNYVVASPNWANGTATGAGAVTWVNGTNGRPFGEASTGAVVSASNSLVGSNPNDLVGSGITTLTSGNYLVRSLNWANGAATNAGALTFVNGTTGMAGPVTAANSLVGSSTGDLIGSGGLVPLASSNYLVVSPEWSNGAASQAGAVTFYNPTTGLTGPVSAANSLVGSTAGDRVGSGGIVQLVTGDYVVRSPVWDNSLATDAGAITVGSATQGITGLVSATNSLIGATAGDQLGSGGITSLSSGKFLVRSPLADGADSSVADAGLLHLVTPVVPFTNPFTFANSPSSTATITPSHITAITNTGTAVTLQANTDITLAAASPITTTAGGSGGALTMQAGRSVLINSNITTDNGNLTITANDPGAQAANRDPGVGSILVGSGASLHAGSGALSLSASDLILNANALIDSSSGAQAINLMNDLLMTGFAATIRTNSGPQSISAGRDIVLSGSGATLSTQSGTQSVTAGRDILVSAGGAQIRVVTGPGSQTVSAGNDLLLSNGGRLEIATGGRTVSTGRNLTLDSATILGGTASESYSVGQDLLLQRNTGADTRISGGTQTFVIGRDLTIQNLFAGSVVRIEGTGSQTFSVAGNLSLASAAGPTAIQVTGAGSSQIFNIGAALNLSGGSGVSARAQISSGGPGATQTIITGGNVTLAGGGGTDAYARIINDPDVSLQVGGTISMTVGSGPGAFARIESVSPAGISVFFPLLASGGYFVNGVEGTVYDPVTSSGFVAGGLPAVLDNNLFITYGGSVAPAPPSLPAAPPPVDNSVLVAIEESSDKFEEFDVSLGGEGGLGDEKKDEKKAPSCS